MLSRSSWKSIFILPGKEKSKKLKNPVIYKKNQVITEFFYKKKVQIYNGNSYEMVLIKDKRYFGFKFGEFILTRVPFLHRRSKDVNKKKVLKEKRRRRLLVKEKDASKKLKERIVRMKRSLRYRRSRRGGVAKRKKFIKLMEKKEKLDEHIKELENYERIRLREELKELERLNSIRYKNKEKIKNGI